MWAAGQAAALLRASSGSVRQRYTGRLLTPHLPERPLAAVPDDGWQVVPLVRVLRLMVGNHGLAVGLGAGQGLGGPGVPHADDGAAASASSMVLEQLELPRPAHGEPANSVPVTSPVFAAFLGAHLTRLSPGAVHYLAGLDAAPPGSSAAERHRAGMAALLRELGGSDRPVRDSERLVAELGPPRDGLAWADLLDTGLLAEHLVYRAPDPHTAVPDGLDGELTAMVRHAIGTAVSTRVHDGFLHWHSHSAPRTPAAPLLTVGRDPAGANPIQVPAVAPSAVSITPDDDEPRVTFTYKVEYGEPPYWQMRVRPTWGSQIASCGWAVIAGHIVLDVLEWHTELGTGLQRPEQILTADIDAHFDRRMHGWRAYATPTTCHIDWTDITRPQLIPDPR